MTYHRDIENFPIEDPELQENTFIDTYLQSLSPSAQDFLAKTTPQITIPQRFPQPRYIVNIPVHYKDYQILNTLDVYAKESFSESKDFGQLKIVIAITGANDDLADPAERKEKEQLLQLLKAKTASLKESHPGLEIFLVDYEYDFSAEKKDKKNPTINTNMGRIRSDLANLSLYILRQGCKDVNLRKSFLVCADADLVHLGRRNPNQHTEQRGFFDRINQQINDSDDIFGGGFVFPEEDYANNELLRYKDRFVATCRLLKHKRLDPQLCYFSEANTLFNMAAYFAVGGYNRQQSLKSESKILVGKIHARLQRQITNGEKDISRPEFKKRVRQRMRYLFGNVAITTNARRPQVAFGTKGHDVGIYAHFETYAKGLDASADYIGNPEKVHLPQVHIGHTDNDFDAALTRSIGAWIQYECFMSKDAIPCLYDGKPYRDLEQSRRKLAYQIDEQYDSLVGWLLRHSDFLQGFVSNQYHPQVEPVSYELSALTYEDRCFLRYLNSTCSISLEHLPKCASTNIEAMTRTICQHVWPDAVLIENIEQFNKNAKTNYTLEQAREMLRLLMNAHIQRMINSLSPMWQKVIRSALFFTGLTFNYDQNHKPRISITPHT